MICTTCGKVIPDGIAVIYGADRGDGKLIFGTTCCHAPVGDVAVILGSSVCAASWMASHGEYIDPILKVFVEHKRANGQSEIQAWAEAVRVFTGAAREVILAEDAAKAETLEGISREIKETLTALPIDRTKIN
jgi:hypothetical protein